MSRRKENRISKQYFEYLQSRNISYEGYVDGLGYVLPEVIVVGYSKNPFHTVFSIHRELSYTIEYAPDEHSQSGRDSVETQMTMHTRAKTAFKRLIEKKLYELQTANLRTDLLQDNPEYNRYKKTYTSLKWSVENGIKIYKTNIPREILGEKATQDYLACFDIEAYDKNQKKIEQHPDYGVPEPILRAREQEKFRKQAYQNWYNADPVASQIAKDLPVGFAAVPLAVGAVNAGGVVALTTGARSMFTINTELWGLKMGMSVGAQTMVNSRKLGTDGKRRGLVNGFQEVNWIAAGGDAFFNIPLTGSMIGGGVEWRPLSQENKFVLTGFNKSVKSTVIDVGSAFVFGKLGSQSWNILNPLMKNTGEQYFFYLSTQTWNYLGGYGAANRLNEQY